MSYRSSNWMGNKTDKKTEESFPVQVTPQTRLSRRSLRPASAQVTPAPDMFTRGPPPVMDIEYIPGYLRKYYRKKRQGRVYYRQQPVYRQNRSSD